MAGVQVRAAIRIVVERDTDGTIRAYVTPDTTDEVLTALLDDTGAAYVDGDRTADEDRLAVLTATAIAMAAHPLERRIVALLAGS